MPRRLYDRLYLASKNNYHTILRVVRITPNPTSHELHATPPLGWRIGKHSNTMLCNNMHDVTVTVGDLNGVNNGGFMPVRRFTLTCALKLQSSHTLAFARNSRQRASESVLDFIP